MKIIVQWVVGVFLGALPLNLQGVDYAIQDLGTLTTDESLATGINNQNTIVGSAKQAGKSDDFIWNQNDGLVFLPYPTYQKPFINNLNQVTGIFWHNNNIWPSSNPRSVFNTRSQHIYIYDNELLLQDLGSPELWKRLRPPIWHDAPDNKGLGILSFNDNQQILLANTKELNVLKATRFAIWQNGTFEDIDSAAISFAYEMNNQGVILARKWMRDGRGAMLVLYNPADETIVEITEDFEIINRKLNDQGQVVILKMRNWQNPSEGYKGFLWDSESGLRELEEDFAPLALNNCNQIVGFKISEFQNKKFVPLMWTPSEGISQIKSNNFEPICSELTSIDGINDNGYIIGQGLFDGKKHAFVLIPQ